MGHDSGSLTITAVSASTQLVKTMSLAKSTAGSDGAAGAQGSTGLDGSSAKSLVASVSSQVFAFDDSSDTTATPGNIIFSFNQQNLNFDFNQVILQSQHKVVHQLQVLILIIPM